MISFVQNRMYRHVNGRLAARLQRKSIRRVISACLLASLFLAALGAQIAGSDVRALVLLEIPMLLFASLLVMSIRGVFELDDSQLDEYQLGLRNDAYKSAYGLTLVFLLVIATIAAGLSLDRMQSFSLAAAAFFTCALAPRVLLAWRMEDDNGEE